MRQLLAIPLLLAPVPAPAQVAYIDGPDVQVTFGWHWDEPVDVLDLTGDARWKVAEATAEWDRHSGAVLRLTTDPAVADIVVREGTLADCGLSFGSTAAGCTYLPPVSGGVATGQSRVYLISAYDDQPAAEHIASHEIGHGLGLDHAPDKARSIMKRTVNNWDFYTEPQSYDYRDMRALYGR